ncbi:DUF1016 N-terminal domain-containing protein [Arthrobacter sp. H14-L1]|uniref:DUF1016 N-terminal domain-containing protein n=1 Tax=Arthrobacter sp. H14-L1 TaxID=2996697 RepID=UPI003B63B2D5
MGSEPIGHAPLARLPWYNNIALLRHLQNETGRPRYAAADIKNGWSRDVLEHQIDTKFYECSGKPSPTPRRPCRHRPPIWPNT